MDMENNLQASVPLNNFPPRNYKQEANRLLGCRFMDENTFKTEIEIALENAFRAGEESSITNMQFSNDDTAFA